MMGVQIFGAKGEWLETEAAVESRHVANKQKKALVLSILMHGCRDAWVPWSAFGTQL
jgi:hypothetical protein